MLKVAKEVVAAVKAGDAAVSSGPSRRARAPPSCSRSSRPTPSGIKIIAANCKVFAAQDADPALHRDPTRRAAPLRLVFTGNAWKVDLATVGPPACRRRAPRTT